MHSAFDPVPCEHNLAPAPHANIHGAAHKTEACTPWVFQIDNTIKWACIFAADFLRLDPPCHPRWSADRTQARLAPTLEPVGSLIVH